MKLEQSIKADMIIEVKDNKMIWKPCLLWESDGFTFRASTLPLVLMFQSPEEYGLKMESYRIIFISQDSALNERRKNDRAFRFSVSLRPRILSCGMSDSFSMFSGSVQTKKGEVMSDCYVGKTKCGCYVTALVINDEHLERLEELSKWPKLGLSIEKHSVEWVRKHLKPCEHKKY